MSWIHIDNRYRIYQFFNLIICLNIIQALSIPESVRVKSELAYSNQKYSELFEIEEYVNTKIGSLNLEVAIAGEDRKVNHPTSYYRLNELNGRNSNPESIVSYDHSVGLCKRIKLNEWRLNVLTNLKDEIVSSKQLNVSSIQDDLTALGPTSFLKIAYNNLKLFKLEQRAFDDARLVDMYYFQAILKLDGGNKVLRLIWLQPFNTISPFDTTMVSSLTLDQIEVNTHPVQLVAIVYNQTDASLFDKLTPIKFLTNSYHYAQRIFLNFLLVEEYSTNDEIAFKKKHFEQVNPFTFPVASGCALVSRHNPLYLRAKQFSALYQAHDSNSRKYIVFDSDTKHMRMDVLGEYKMIVDLQRKSLTYTSDSTSIQESIFVSSDKLEGAHCNQLMINKMNLKLSRDDSIFLSSATMHDVLGIDLSDALAYLGYTFLHDGSRCLIFEREIPETQIPIIVKSNLKANIEPNSRLFMVYYFVNEEANGDDDQQYQGSHPTNSMWIKQIELLGYSSMLKSTLKSYVRLIFSEFVWSLEALGEDTRDRGSKLMHPVRVFDTDQCKNSAADSAIQLEILIRLYLEQTAKANVTKEVISIEESLISLISKTLKIPRSLITDFEAIQVDSKDPSLLFVKSKIVEPLNSKVETELLGYIESLDSIPFQKNGDFIKQEAGINRHVCELSLANKFDLKRSIMVHCPGLGCGYFDQLDGLSYVNKTDSKKLAQIINNYDMCEIHQLTKVSNMNLDLNDNFSIDRIKSNLKSMDKNLILYSDDGSINVYKANMTKFYVSNKADSRASIIKQGVCYKPETKLTSTQLNIELKFDVHHSLAHCLLACQLLPNCRTYSFNGKFKKCILSNLERKYIPADDSKEKLADSLELDNTCNLYTFNSVELYKSQSLARSTSLSEFAATHYLGSHSLRDCAELCRSHEYDPFIRLNCSDFNYFKLESICAIPDKEQRLFGLNNSPERDSSSQVNRLSFYRNLVGDSQWNKLQIYHKYTREFDQYYNKQDYVKVTFKSDQGDDELKFKTLYDIPLEECLKECSLVNSRCLMVDFCIIAIDGYPTRTCDMFHIRSPLTIRDGISKLSPTSENDRSLRAKLSKLESLYYIQNNSRSEDISMKKMFECQHHYMDGETLFIKKLISDKSPSAFINGESLAVAELDRMLSDNFLKLLDKLGHHYNSTRLAGFLTSLYVQDPEEFVWRYSRMMNSIRFSGDSSSPPSHRISVLELNQLVRNVDSKTDD